DHERKDAVPRRRPPRGARVRERTQRPVRVDWEANVSELQSIAKRLQGCLQTPLQLSCSAKSFSNSATCKPVATHLQGDLQGSGPGSLDPPVHVATNRSGKTNGGCDPRRWR